MTNGLSPVAWVAASQDNGPTCAFVGRTLDAWKIKSAELRRLVTEGALWANLLAHNLYSDLVLISDDAAHFKLLAFLHALCWVHMERHVA